LFSLEKVSAAAAYQRPLNIPMGSLKITQMFAFVPPPSPPAPNPSPNLHSCSSEEKEEKEQSKTKSDLYLKKQYHHQQHFKMASVRYGSLLKEIMAKVVNLNINDREGGDVLMHEANNIQRSQSPICLPLKCTMLETTVHSCSLSK